MDYDKILEEQNKNYLNELAEYIEKNLVIPFVGAGLSVPIYPLWGQFFSNVLNTILIRPSTRKEIQELLEKHKYEQAASVLEKSVGNAQYVSIIKNTFSDSKIPKDDTLKDMAIRILPQIFKNNTVITTNFDRLLNQVFADEGYGFKGDITPYEDSKIARSDFKRGIVNYLLKLHGDYLHVDKIVFTEEQYDICYGKDLDSPYLSFLTDVLNTKVLFLGCSLEEDRTMKLLEKIALNHSQTHYAIVENPYDAFDDEFFDKRERLSNMGINCIWYPKNKHDSVSHFLNEIKKKIVVAPPSHPPQVITTTSVQKPCKDFLGRDDEIKQIKENLRSDTKLVLVNGIGGIGKTQICSFLYHQYRNRNANEIQYLGWISYEKDLKSSFFQKMDEIKGIEDINDYFNEIQTLLKRFGNTLLLFIDNANNLTTEDQKWISSLECNVIVTSRNKDWNESFQPIEIGRLSEKDCMNLYIKTVGTEENRTIIKEIVKRVDRHTVTIVLLAKTQKYAGMTAEQLLTSIQKSGLNLSDIQENVKHEDKNMVFIQHLRKLFEIVNLSVEEIQILKLFSLFPYEPLEQDYIKQWFELQSYNEINPLVDKGWIMKEDNNHLLMHPVISSVMKANYKITLEECEPMMEQIANAISYTAFDDYTKKWVFSPFAVSVANYFKIESLCHKTLGNLFSNVGRVYQDQGEYEKALEFYNKALAILKTKLGEQHPYTITVFSNLQTLKEGME